MPPKNVSTPPPPLKTAKNLQESSANFDAIVAWAINAPSGIGYFATIYKRATIAVSNAIDTGKFQQPEVMTRFTLTFSQRYFDALNAHFHPNDYKGPTHVWQWAFDGVDYAEPIIFQHLLTAVDAHINLDLGITAAQVGAGAMDDLHHDFHMINAILGSQVQGVFDALAEVSPRTHTRVDEDGVAVRQIRLDVQVEHDPVHPPRGQAVDVRQLRVRGTDVVGEQILQPLDRHRREVVVGLDHRRTARTHDRHTGDRLSVALDSGDRVTVVRYPPFSSRK
jgi:hypothetical protein